MSCFKFIQATMHKRIMVDRKETIRVISFLLTVAIFSQFTIENEYCKVIRERQIKHS